MCGRRTAEDGRRLIQSSDERSDESITSSSLIASAVKMIHQLPNVTEGAFFRPYSEADMQAKTATSCSLGRIEHDSPEMMSSQ